MIIYTHQKSKRRKPNAKQRELQSDWNKLLDKYSPKKIVVQSESKKYEVAPLPHREIHSAKSYDSGVGAATKPIHGKVYTGNKMIGIGTLHKSNAVPIFTDQEAKDQASMRR
jgi:hypothetical protein